MARAGGHGMGNPVNVGIAVQADWENREFISNISLNVRRLFDFLLRFGPFFLFLLILPIIPPWTCTGFTFISASSTQA